MELDKSLCQEFLLNPKINPLTNSPITRDGPEYRSFQERCKKYIKTTPSFTSAEELLINEYCTGIEKTDEAREKVKELMKRAFKTEVDKRMLERKSFNPAGTRFCHNFVPADKEIECISGRRSIVVLDFLGLESTPLIQDYNFCDVTYKDKIKYYIKYIPVPYGTNTLDLADVAGILNSNCNSMVIHVDIRDSSGGDDIVLLQMVKKQINTFLVGYEIPKVMYVFSNIYSLSYTLDFPDINELRVLNVIKTGTVYRYEVSNFDFIPFMPLDKTDDEINLKSNTDRLSCQWWFKRFFSTVFECGKGRLIQFSGTCYINSVMNTLILGEYMKRLIINSINTWASIFTPDEIDMVKRPIDYGVCVDIKRIKELRERVIFYSKIFYNTVCATKSLSRITPVYRDVFKTPAMYYFKGHDAPIDPDAVQGFGGNPGSVLYRILNDLLIKAYIVDAEGNFYDMHSGDGDKIFNLFRLANVKYALSRLQKVNLPDPTDENYPDVIVFFNYQYGDEPRQIPKLPSNFALETASLSSRIKITSPDGSISDTGHIVTGFICDGYYKIFDSAYNTIDNHDWRDTHDLLNSSYAKRKRDLYNWDFIDARIDTAVFVNYNKRLEYLESGVCRV